MSSRRYRYIVTDGEGLFLTFHDDGDGTGELSVSMSFEGWAGHSEAYFVNRDLLAFAEQMTAFPFPADHSFQIAGGYMSATGDGLEEELVGLRVRPVGRKGQIGVMTHLATRRDDPPMREVTVEVLTTYEALQRFSKDLMALITGHVQEAVLDAEVMA